MPTRNLCDELLKQYQCQTKSQLSAAAAAAANRRRRSSLASIQPQPQEDSAAANSNNGRLDDQYLVAKKRRVIKFIRCWMLITREHFFQQHQIQSFLAVSSFIS